MFSHSPPRNRSSRNARASPASERLARGRASRATRALRTRAAAAPTTANDGPIPCALREPAEHGAEDRAEDGGAERRPDHLSATIAWRVTEIQASAPAHVAVLATPWTNRASAEGRARCPPARRRSWPPREGRAPRRRRASARTARRRARRECRRTARPLRRRRRGARRRSSTGRTPPRMPGRAASAR